MDRFHSLSVFVAVAEEAGFAAAARRLQMSPPAVTRAVAALEERLGAKLLHRTTRSVQLSDTGRRYLADGRRILAELEAADRHAGGLHAAPRGPVSLSASVLFGRLVLSPHLLGLMDRYPEIELTALFVDRVVHLLDEGVDVAVRIAELPDSSLSAVRVGQLRRVLCAAPGYLAERGTPAAPADLAGHEVIDFVNMAPAGEWGFLDPAGQPQSFRPRARLKVNNADTAIAAAVAGRGIVRVLSYMIGPHLADGRLALVLDHVAPPPVPVHVVHKEPGRTSARVRAVVDHLVDALRRESCLR